MNAKFALPWMSGALCALAILSSGMGAAQVQAPSVLGRLRAGGWELRMRDGSDAPKRMCLRDGRRLIQLRHPGQRCSRMVVEDTPEQITVQYTCPGRGYGRTQIRFESESLVQIESQGIAEGLPFAFAGEVRRIGSCRN